MQDDPVQSRQATHLIARECTKESPGFLNRMVLGELVWVLESAYGYPTATIVGVLEKVLKTSQFHIEELSVAWTAFRLYQKGKADVADCLLGAVNCQRGGNRTGTFDRQAGRARIPERDLICALAEDSTPPRV